MPPDSAIDSARGAIAPGGVLGVLGGGQLGRMTAQAAARLGYRTVVFEPQAACPAAQVAPHIQADYGDEAALERFAARVDAVTLEFENVPVAALDFLADRVPVRPGHTVLATAQDRVVEKRFLNEAGVETAPWAEVTDRASLDAALAEIGLPSVLKTCRMGYDGKGQAMLRADMDADALSAAWESLGGVRCILEGFVDFSCELSVIAARGTDGAVALFPPVMNEHRNHILHRTIAPAPLDAGLIDKAEETARRAVEGLDVTGLLAIEMFATPDGRILANEIAPRPHNSGHWTLDACVTDQFEQLVRAVMGLPLGGTDVLYPAEMTNLIGDEAADWPAILADPNAKLHLYGKSEARPGRKMGHVTRLRR